MSVKTLDRLIKAYRDNPDVARLLIEARQRMVTPLTKVLAKVPGKTNPEKIRAIGVSKQTYYLWLRGAARPNPAQAARLEELTGISIEKIRGRSTAAASAAPPVTTT